MAPGANIGDEYAFFEATHGTAPKYADLDVINPASVILSGCMMFDFIGWNDVAKPALEHRLRDHFKKLVLFPSERAEQYRDDNALRARISELETEVLTTQVRSSLLVHGSCACCSRFLSVLHTAVVQRQT